MSVNHIITTTTRGGTYRYKFRMCFKEMSTRFGIRQHCVQEHVQRCYIDFRYPFHLGESAIIASGDKDKCNNKVDQGTLPLQLGILILRFPVRAEMVYPKEPRLPHPPVSPTIGS